MTTLSNDFLSHTDRQTDRHTNRDTEADRQIHKQTETHTYKTHTDRQTHTQTDRQKDTQTDRHTLQRDTHTLKERRNRQELIEVFKMYKGVTNMDKSELFTKDSKVKGTSSHTLKLEKPGSIMDSMKLYFSHSVIGR